MESKKFWAFNQNNSGGYFVVDDDNGVCEWVIIEAKTPKKAWKKLKKIGKRVQGFWDYCNCCGERWYNYMDESDGTDKPMIYGEGMDKCERTMFRHRCFVHYANGVIKEFKFKEQQ